MHKDYVHGLHIGVQVHTDMHAYLAQLLPRGGSASGFEHASTAIVQKHTTHVCTCRSCCCAGISAKQKSDARICTIPDTYIHTYKHTTHVHVCLTQLLLCGRLCTKLSHTRTVPDSCTQTHYTRARIPDAAAAVWEALHEAFTHTYSSRLMYTDTLHTCTHT